MKSRPIKRNDKECILIRLQTLSASAVALLLLAVSCGGSGGTQTNGAPTPPTEFSQTDLTTGTGTQAGTGARITVNYTGWVYDASKPENKGEKFDSSIGRAVQLYAGRGEVISGWDQGFTGMR
jgi:hypothetical protein